mmetsp:Transcript_5453/g.12092  ORF Transcript_5453/g.12092 Transcript_5453/m.12092 type:complete len:81 (-) Transcript_5453:436-678(-)
MFGSVPSSRKGGGCCRLGHFCVGVAVRVLIGRHLSTKNLAREREGTLFAQRDNINAPMDNAKLDAAKTARFLQLRHVSSW